MKLKLEIVNSDREWSLCSYAEKRMRHWMCYHDSNGAEVAAYLEMLRRWKMTHGRKGYDCEWRHVAWLLSGLRGCRQHVRVMENAPKWTYGGTNERPWLRKSKPVASLQIDDSERFASAIFDHRKLFRNADGSRRLLACMDYPPEDREKLRQMAERYGLYYKEITYQDHARWIVSCMANFKLE